MCNNSKKTKDAIRGRKDLVFEGKHLQMISSMKVAVVHMQEDLENQRWHHESAA